LKVMRDERPVTVEVTSDGAGLVSHAGTALVAQVADKLGLTAALSVRLGWSTGSRARPGCWTRFVALTRWRSRAGA
jgi:hypothetical protein